MQTSGWYWFLVVYILVGGTGGRIVRRNVGIEVRNGRSITMVKENFDFNVNPGEICKVEVVTNEPLYQRVGLFKPEIFDCDYIPGSLQYQHDGSPFLNKDVVKMRAYVLLGNQTMQEELFLHISVLDSRCDVIRVNRVPVEVPTRTKNSNPVTRDVVDFDYDRRRDNLCHVLLPQEGFPRYGRLVVPANSSAITGVEYIAVDNLKETCEDFVLMGIRYEHLYPPTPDLDYIPLHVQITDRRSGSMLLEEHHWLPVRINEAYPNQPPKASFSNMYILEVDQFILTNLLPMTISAVDEETRNEHLIFNITKPPVMGFITHLQDQTKPIQSFWQQDLQDLQIAYQPPNVSFTERQTFQVEFVVYDAYFAKSEPIRAMFSVRVAYTNAPRVSWNMGLTMLEGQSRVIDHDCLQVVDKDNLDQVRFTLAGGLRHGRLYVGERAGYSFGWADVVNGLVSYRHDDTDTRKDFISFRITDRTHSVRFKLPITILPKDDAPPFLINNIAFEVQEGQTILIHRFMLEASDADTVADYVTFNITTPPRAGEVQKRRAWERVGWAINSFQQLDLYKGLIFYKHLGNEVFEDFFEFVLLDANQPTPNVSPVHRVEIKITPVDDLLPEPGPGNALTLTVNETDVVYITAQHLNYIDTEEANSDVTYTITTDLYQLDGTERDSGKLIFTDDMVMLMKDPSVPTLRTFTQNAVNHNKVAYMPPIQDIGRHPIDVQFVFSISDIGGRQLNGTNFAITVLPVDNQAPAIQVTELCLNEGGTELIAPDLLQLQDEDTELGFLRIILSSLPVTGSVRNDNIPLRKGDSFNLQDVELFRMTYVHNGSEIHKDRFQLTVTDGKQNSSVIMGVKMDPIDDEQPQILASNSSLHVAEGGSTVLTKSFLSATDVDTNDEQLIFEVLTPPRLGSFQINGENVITFLQVDITQGRIFYVHNGREVGRTPLHDLATVMVSDRRGQPIDDTANSVKTKDLHFTIVPVNSRPPRVALGHRVFRCSEGGNAVISQNFLMADDDDTPMDQLRYLVETPPSYGYIEDVTPRPGYESINGVETTSFTHEQLLSGFIRYKQADHQGIEPTSDQFSIAVTDGQFKSVSVPFLISITPTNDEEPIISIENVTCNEGFMKVLSLDVEDMDMPKDEVMISVIRPPAHGMIMDEMEMLSRMRRSSGGRQNSSMISHAMHHMDPMDEFSLANFKANRVIPAYAHDGSENIRDEFEVKITDGSHVSRKLLRVDVTPVNDEKPRIVINREMTVEFGETKVISGVVLHATDVDTPSTELVYELHSIPKRGDLQLKMVDDLEAIDDSAWITLRLSDSFTDYDIEMNRLRYRHAGVPGSKPKDTFRFSVTDGEFLSPRQNFQIIFETPKKNALFVTTHPLHVNEGERSFVTADVLTASDGFQDPQRVVYDVIRQPGFGQLEYVAFPDVPIEMFTHVDVLARNVMYVHTSKEDSPVDSFRVSVSTGFDSKEAEVPVLITSVDTELPVLITGNNNSPLPSGAPQMSLFRGATVVLSHSVIRLEDPDSPRKNLKLIVLSLPEHGSLILNGVDVAELNAQVSDLDLENSRFFYHHNEGDAEIDRFSFIVTDGVHSEYIYKGVRRQEPITFYLRIESLDESAPVIVTNSVPTFIQPVGNGRFSEIVLDNHVLEARDQGTEELRDISFAVASPPLYGQLYLKSDRDLSSPIHRFTQYDLNHRDVIYVIASRLDVTNDSFYFDVEDSWGNTLFAQRFSMSWSRMEMVERKIKVCEDAGLVPVQVRRYGNVMTSSFIGVKLKGGTATPGVDFMHSTATQIQFDRDWEIQSWNLNVINDTLEERVEKVKIQLHSPDNCVLAPKKISTLVIILDQRHKTCQKRRRKAKTPKRRTQTRHRNAFHQDSSQSQTTADRRKIRYGKLPSGTTVAPQTFFKNKTVRIWRYHALLPVTIDEDYEDRIGILNQPTPMLLENSALSVDDNQESETLQDDPEVVEKQQQPRTFSETLRVENTNISAVVTVRDRKGRERVESLLPSSVEQSCILAKTGALYYDSNARVLYRCDGASWVRWRKPRKLPKTKENNLEVPQCDGNWRGFENKCYLIGSGNESWNSAQRICREEHSANLLTLNGKKLVKWIRKIVKRRPVWIGLNRKVDPHLWEWVSGDKVDFTYWRRSFPTSTSGRDCAYMSAKGQWFDSRCNRPDDIRFVCEKLP